MAGSPCQCRRAALYLSGWAATPGPDLTGAGQARSGSVVTMVRAPLTAVNGFRPMIPPLLSGKPEA